jgi:hypothetical protein
VDEVVTVDNFGLRRETTREMWPERADMSALRRIVTP